MILCMPERVSGGGGTFQGFCGRRDRWEGPVKIARRFTPLTAYSLSDVEIPRDETPIAGLSGFTEQPSAPADQDLMPEGRPAEQKNKRG